MIGANGKLMTLLRRVEEVFDHNGHHGHVQEIRDMVTDIITVLNPPSIREWVIFLQIKRDEQSWESRAASATAWVQQLPPQFYSNYHSFYNPRSTWHERTDNEVDQEVYL